MVEIEKEAMRRFLEDTNATKEQSEDEEFLRLSRKTFLFQAKMVGVALEGFIKAIKNSFKS